MIKLALVCPPNEPYWALLGDGIHLVQAAWCLKSQAYMDFYRLAPGYKILDYQHIGAGAPEARMPWDEFVRVAGEVQPDEVVLPDVLDNAEVTLANLQFLEQLPTVYNVLFVPQGRTIQEWYRCLVEGWKRLTRDWEGNVVIGICKKSQALDPYHRSYAISLASRHADRKQLHILGARNIQEFEELAHLDVRSWDTSLPIAAAQTLGLLATHDHDWKPQLNEDGLNANPQAVLENVYLIQKLLAQTPETWI